MIVAFICKPLDDPLNGMVEFSNRTYGGSMATYSCDDGYELDGDSSTRTCTFNQTDICWTGDAPNCSKIGLYFINVAIIIAVLQNYQ